MLYRNGKALRYLTLTFLLAALMPAQPPVPTYAVKRAAAPINIDGKLDDKAWESAAPIEFLFPWDFQTGAKQKTTAKIMWDSEYLYVGYQCEDKDIVALHLQRDDPTYKDDAVEIFINGNPSQQRSYYGLEMNARAILYDYLMADGRVYKRFQLEGVKLASFIEGTLNTRGDEDKGWSLEVAIPWRNFEEMSKLPAAGTKWTVALNRWDGVEPDRRLSMWSNPLHPKPNPHVAARFGELTFVE